MKLRNILSAASLIISCSSVFGLNYVIDMAAKGVKPDRVTNSTPLVNKILSEIPNNLNGKDTVTVRFAPGKYNFHPDKSTERTLYISNHDQTNPKQIGLLLEQNRNVIIDGCDAEFIFHSRMLPVAAINCCDLTIKDLTIDFEKPHIAQVEIVENDTIAGEITYRPAPWVDYKIKGGDFVNCGENWQQTPCTGIAFEKDTRHIVYNTSDIAVGTKNVVSAGKGIVKAPWNNPKLKPGTIVAMRTYERPAPGIFIDGCISVNLSNVTVHYAEGMGLLAQNTNNINMDGFKVCLRGESDPRYFTTQADASHFSGCLGTIRSVNGVYEGMMDDAINVHGTYLKVVERVDSTTLIGEYMHHQSYGFSWGNTYDTINVIKTGTMDKAKKRLVIKKIKAIDAENDLGAKKFMIQFEQALPAEINPLNGSFGLENISASPKVIFADNIVRNNRARGALFSTPRQVICERNVFDHTSGCAILLCGDCNGWYETGSCRDVTIRNNKFINSLTNLFQFTNAVISIYPEIPDLENQLGYFHSNISITDNVFETFDIPLLYAKSVDGLIFQKNTIKRNNDYPPFHWNKSQIWLERVNNARLQAVE